MKIASILMVVGLGVCAGTCGAADRPTAAELVARAKEGPSLLLTREGLTARKKWTFDRGGVLCEGSGITATDGRYEVATSVEQAMAASNAGVVYRRKDA